jgi:cell shape-determining protein MreC
MFRWWALWHSGGRYLFYFLLLVFGWWLVPEVLRLGVRDVLQELQAPLWYGEDALHRVKDYWQLRSLSKEKLIREIVILSRKLSALELARNSAINLDDAHLHAIFVGDSLGAFRTLFTRILRRDEKSWWQEVVLSGGHNHGIGENMAIINGRGLIGKTLRVFSHHSVGILITDPRFRSVVHLRNDPRPIIFQGAFQEGFGKPIGHVSHISLDVHASKEQPLVVVTSSLAGVYPDGIPIGMVTHLHNSSDGIFQEGTVILNSDLLGVREAVVLLPESNTADD